MVRCPKRNGPQPSSCINSMKEPAQRILKVDERPINLTQVLKLAGCVESGGAAKAADRRGPGPGQRPGRAAEALQDEGRRHGRDRRRPDDRADVPEPRLNRAWHPRTRTHSRSASELQPGGNSASSISMLGMSSLMENRGPHRVQISVSPSRRRGALPRGQTRSDSNSSFTMGQFLVRMAAYPEPIRVASARVLMITPAAVIPRLYYAVRARRLKSDSFDGRGLERWRRNSARGRFALSLVTEPGDNPLREPGPRCVSAPGCSSGESSGRRSPGG